MLKPKLKPKTTFFAALVLLVLVMLATPAALPLLSGLSAGPAGAAPLAPVVSQTEETPEAANVVTLQGPEAFAWALENAEKGDPAAMLALGNFYEHGVGTLRHYGQALAWYQKAADAGRSDALYNVGICYEIGMGTAPDVPKALAAFEKAAARGFAPAAHKAAALYLAEGPLRNEIKGLEYLQKSAQMGNPAAAVQLGAVYLKGALGQPQDAQKALKWFSRAADLGNMEAAKNLGVMYRDGLGTKADPALALMWYTIAQRGGYPAPDLPVVMDAVKAGLTPEQIAKAEADAAQWLKNVQATMRAAHSQAVVE